jgi:phosphoglycerate dehydrogenase-like enzyme
VPECPLCSAAARSLSVLPLSAETEGILNVRTLAMLPKGAALINVARGCDCVGSRTFWGGYYG